MNKLRPDLRRRSRPESDLERVMSNIFTVKTRTGMHDYETSLNLASCSDHRVTRKSF